MYRLFCNNRTLECRNFFEQSLNDDINDSVFMTQSFDNMLDKVKKWLENGTGNLVVDDVDNDVFAAVIRRIFRFAPAAGGVVVVNDSIVAIERNGIPDLPKGHIEKNEPADLAAMREVREETAISDLEIIRQLPSTFHCYLLNGQWTMKKTSWFLMKSDEFNPKPQEEEGISRVFLLNSDNVDDFFDKTYISIRTSLEDEIRNLLK